MAELATAALFGLALFVLAPTLPMEAALLAAGDLTAYLEVLGAVTLIAVRSRGLRRLLRDLVVRRTEGAGRWVRRSSVSGRERRSRIRRPARSATGDGDRQSAWAPALA